jgi:uncharacterized membrane protein YfcA
MFDWCSFLMILNPYPLAFTLSLGIGVIAAVIGLGGGFFMYPHSL